MMSCGVEPSEVGSDFFTGGALDFAYIDSSSVKLSTVKFERISTSGADRILLGAYNDEKLGALIASAFIQLNPSAPIDLQYEDITYDHLALVLKYDNYFYYDSSQLTLNVSRVSEEMALDDGALYNTSAFAVYDEVLGTVSVRPRPHRDDSLEIRLNDELGQEIFNKAISADDDLTSTDFTKYIRGLAITPDTSATQGIIGFSTSPELRLYYRDRGTTPVTQKYVSISTNRYFTRLQPDENKTDLYAVEADDHLNASQTNDIAFIQAGTGLALRVEFPYLRELKQFTNVYVIQATLEICPVWKSFSETTPLPQSLLAYTVDRYNSVYQQLDNTATFFEDLEVGRDSRYIFNVTDFVKEQMELPRFREDALVFTNLDGYSSTVDRLYAASPSYNYKTQLKIYYATVNNE
ncbi:MAG TPA: DUF4270 family protein [Ohtaekwangia sp.]